jgi:peptidyl-prolyl cis-trans isomerase A (cyclophilin A)
MKSKKNRQNLKQKASKKDNKKIFSFIIISILGVIIILALLLWSGGDPSMNRIAVIETNMGTMELELFEDKAPITTSNFINLTEQGFYDGIIFHRIIDGFMIQGGDPTGTGMGGSENTVLDEFHEDLKHDSKGILSMANRGPNTGTSQFFITLAPQPHLNGLHSVFGKVISGEDVLEKIGSVQTGANDKPIEDVVMTKVTISEK